MRNKVFRKDHYLLTIILLIFAMLIVACDPGDDEGSGVEPGADTGDVVATDVGVENFPEATTPVEDIIDPTAPIVDPTPMEEPTDEPIVEPTEEMEAEPTATVEVMATESMTDTQGTSETDVFTEDMGIEGIQAVLASDLVGMDITGNDGEEVGEVSELLLNQDGSIAYALFDVGGFLGIADKTVAVSWDNFEIRHEDDVMMGEGDTDNTGDVDDAGTEDMDVVDDVEDSINIDEYTIVYTGVATDLENLPEFDTGVLDLDGYVLDDMATDAADDATETDIEEFDSTPYIGQLQVGEFEDYNLLNMQDEDLGEVEDLIIDVHEGQVSYAVVDFGGFLGIAENSVALPWEQLALEPDTETFRLDVDAPTLESAPPFDFDTWDYPLEQEWDTDYRAYWEAV